MCKKTFPTEASDKTVLNLWEKGICCSLNEVLSSLIYNGKSEVGCTQIYNKEAKKEKQSKRRGKYKWSGNSCWRWSIIEFIERLCLKFVFLDPHFLLLFTEVEFSHFPSSFHGIEDRLSFLSHGLEIMQTLRRRYLWNYLMYSRIKLHRSSQSVDIIFKTPWGINVSVMRNTKFAIYMIV